ncbi:hypothetical protein [Flavobacterium rhizosphaerae]|uniref:Peptidase M10 metallopeptidase domain-containing protein n=1 Tax=Flavobacterium rhizosphaerae TaxID=3163298 RepID=A0ABW8YZC1_9FLAO
MVENRDNGGNVTRKYVGGHTSKLGDTQKNGFNVVGRINGKIQNFGSMAHTLAHEAGHTAGLRHPWGQDNQVSDVRQGSPNVKDKTIKRNLMNSAANPIQALRSNDGKELTPGQFKAIDELIESRQ